MVAAIALEAFPFDNYIVNRITAFSRALAIGIAVAVHTIGPSNIPRAPDMGVAFGIVVAFGRACDDRRNDERQRQQASQQQLPELHFFSSIPRYFRDFLRKCVFRS